MSLNSICPQCKGDLRREDGVWVVVAKLTVAEANKIAIGTVQLRAVPTGGGQEQPVALGELSITNAGNWRFLEWPTDLDDAPAAARLTFTYRHDDGHDEEEELTLTIDDE